MLIKEPHEQVHMWQNPPGLTKWEEALNRYAETISRNPWLDEQPFLIRITPLRGAKRILLADDQGQALSLAPAFAADRELLALSGGWPVNLFGLWDGEFFAPLSAVANETVVALTGKGAAQ
jgi:hypothetical protein